MQQVEDVCSAVKQEHLPILHCDIVAILWHSPRKPAVSPGPPPAESEGKVVLKNRVFLFLLDCLFVFRQKDGSVFHQEADLSEMINLSISSVSVKILTSLFHTTNQNIEDKVTLEEPLK